LTAQEADVQIDLSLLAFKTTKEVEPLDTIIGQDRAMEALDVGLGIHQEGYNIYVAGLTGTGKMETIRQTLRQRLEGTPVPEDWVYVNNFDNSDEPWAIRLPPGQGKQFAEEMDHLVEHVQENLPKAFLEESFGEEKERLSEKFEMLIGQAVEKLSERASRLGFEFHTSQDGNLFFVPLINGQPLKSEEQAKALSEAERARIERDQKELAKEASRMLEEQRELQKELRDEVRRAQRRQGAHVVHPLIQGLKESYRDHPRVQEYLERVSEHILNNLSDFREGEKQKVQHGPVPGSVIIAERISEFLEYKVNVVVDNGRTKGAPVVIEEVPTFPNLFGTIEKTVEFPGRVVTDFTQIKSGSLLRASGGYLIFNLEDALTEPLVYKNLKRALKSGRLQLEAYDPWSLFRAGGLRPEPIPIRTKVVVVGPPWLYHTLCIYDDEFAAIFKVKADFGTEMPRQNEEQRNYARFIAKLTKDEGLRPFSRDAVVELVRFGARQTEEKDKLSTRFSEVADLIREASFFAGRDGAEVVQQAHVGSALESRVFRSERIAEKIRELTRRGILLIDTRERKVGQVNGLAVIDMGDYAFGRPCRVSASLGLGMEGVINVEREAKLSGSTHDKGIMILSGYLRDKYGKDKPLALSASICFEQSYSGIDGDSASSTELYALLSNLAAIPLRQDIAVTGSINQWGEIQAIGGVNEKVEGFFDVCKETGLTGHQGVCIPASNVQNVVLRKEVRQAIADGKFHLYPIKDVDEGLELLSGVKAGAPDQEGTFHWLVDQKLLAMAEVLHSFDTGRETASYLIEKTVIPADKPPKLPGENR
jgi:ATP-dependent Lon protease